MGKNQSASNLTNIIKQDASGNITFVSGSTTLMSVSSSGAVTTTGNVAGTASYASNAELLDGLNSTVFATTGSNTFAGIQTVNSNLVVTGSITAQTLVVQTITSSVDFVTGSTRFGSLSSDTMKVTGSLLVTGSSTLSGSIATTGNITLNKTSPNIFMRGGYTQDLGFFLNNEPAVYIVDDATATKGMKVNISTGAITQLGNGSVSFTGAATFSGGVIGVQGTNQNFIRLSPNAGGAGFSIGRSLSTNDAQDFFIYDGIANQTRLFINSSGNVLIGTTTSNSFNFVASPNGHSFLGNTMQISAGDFGGTERQGAFGVAEWANEQSPVINLASIFPRLTISGRALGVLVQISTSNNTTSHCSALVLFSRTINSGWSSTIIANINNGGTSLSSVSGSGTSITLNFNNFNFGSAMITILNRA